MKTAMLAASAASLLGSAAASHARHQAMHMRRGGTAGYLYPTDVVYEEVCETYTTTYYGEMTLVPAPPPASTVYVTPSPATPIPTADVTTCETPGTYTFPAKTTTIVETTTVCGDTTTVVPSGSHTYGGVTTSVATATTVVCPIPSVKTEGTVVTSVVETTTYVCPSGGVYTIAPHTTYVEEEATIVYPTVSVFVPGTYTKPEQTVTVVKTSEVYVCPYETVVPPKPSAPATSATPAPPKVETSAPVYSAPAPPKVETSAPVYSAPTPPKVETSAPVYSAPPAPSKPAEKPSETPKESPKPKPSAPAHGGSGRVITKGNKWAMTYTPYGNDSNCKSKSEVDSDIAEIAKKGFTTIRSYSTDCGVFENVVPACKANGLKIILGIFLSEKGGPDSSYANEQLEQIKNNAPKDDTVMVIVGNECIFAGYCTADGLASYINKVRSELHGAGFSKDIAITTTEPVNVWEQYGSALCSCVDVFTAQVHPFFDMNTQAKDAGKFAAKQLAQAAAVCPEAASKGTYITEIGWPSAGDDSEIGQKASKEAQKVAITEILKEVGDHSILFSFDDDKWKGPGAYSVEQNFGCKDVL